MASLASFLPFPANKPPEAHPIAPAAAPQPITQTPKAKKVFIPPYGKRKGWIPRRLDDFGDGGAFPEIHVSQYPLEMGRPDKSAAADTRQVIPVSVDASGQVRHDAVVVQSSTQRVFSRHSDLVARNFAPEALARPSEEEVDAVTAETKAALEQLVDRKIAAARPTNPAEQRKAATYVQYTPISTSADGAEPQTRIIRMVELPQDPLEPPKFKHKRAPRGPPSPPVPVLHSPPRKVTAEEQATWKIPPCISNWKNNRGYTIPLDKRLAADGRGMAEVSMNDKFAKFAEALYVAERNARVEVTTRAAITKKLLLKEKERQEELLKKMANDARLERAAGLGPGAAASATAATAAVVPLAASPPAVPAAVSPKMEMPERSEPDTSDTRTVSKPPQKSSEKPEFRRSRSRSRSPSSESDSDTDRRHRRHRGSPSRQQDDGMTEEERKAKAERDALREERRRERERQRRREALKGARKGMMARDEDRDISERVALGQVSATTLSRETMYDARLFNQTSEGLDSGFGPDDAYNIYDRPMFQRGSLAASIYRPRRSDVNNTDMMGGEDEVDEATAERNVEKLKSTDRFRPDRDFAGVDRSKPRGPREGPVEFEKSADDSRPATTTEPHHEDPYGLNAFITSVKRADEGRRRTLDSIGRGGTMSIAAGGGSTYDMLKEGRTKAVASARRGGIAFTEGRESPPRHKQARGREGEEEGDESANDRKRRRV